MHFGALSSWRTCVQGPLGERAPSASPHGPVHAGRPLGTHGGLLNRCYLLPQVTYNGRGLCLWASRPLLNPQRTVDLDLGADAVCVWGGAGEEGGQ